MLPEFAEETVQAGVTDPGVDIVGKPLQAMVLIQQYDAPDEYLFERVPAQLKRNAGTRD